MHCFHFFEKYMEILLPGADENDKVPVWGSDKCGIWYLKVAVVNIEMTLRFLI